MVEESVLDIGEVRLGGECFLLTSGTEVVDFSDTGQGGLAVISVGDLNEGDEVGVTAVPPPVDNGDPPTAVKIERYGVARPPEPMRVHSRVASIEPESGIFCVEGPSFQVESDKLTVEFPDGSTATVGEARKWSYPIGHPNPSIWRARRFRAARCDAHPGSG